MILKVFSLSLCIPLLRHSTILESLKEMFAVVPFSLKSGWFCFASSVQKVVIGMHGAMAATNVTVC